MHQIIFFLSSLSQSVSGLKKGVDFQLSWFSFAEADDYAISVTQQRPNADAPTTEAIAKRGGHSSVASRSVGCRQWRAVPDCEVSEDQSFELTKLWNMTMDLIIDVTMFVAKCKNQTQDVVEKSLNMLKRASAIVYIDM